MSNLIQQAHVFLCSIFSSHNLYSGLRGSSQNLPKHILHSCSCFYIQRWHEYTLLKGLSQKWLGHWNHQATLGLWRAFSHKPFSIGYLHYVKWLSPGTLPWTQSAVYEWHYHGRVLGPEASRGVSSWATSPDEHAYRAHWTFTATVLANATKQGGYQPLPGSDTFPGCWWEKTTNPNSSQKTSSRFSGMICTNITDHTMPLSKGVSFSFSTLTLKELNTTMKGTYTNAKSHL